MIWKLPLRYVEWIRVYILHTVYVQNQTCVYLFFISTIYFFCDHFYFVTIIFEINYNQQKLFFPFIMDDKNGIWKKLNNI